MVITPTDPTQVDLQFFTEFKEEIARFPIVDGIQAQRLANKAAMVAYKLSELKAGVYHFAEVAESEAKRLLAQGKLGSEGKNADAREAEARNHPAYIAKVEEVARARAAQYHLQESYEMTQALHYFYSAIYKGENKISIGG